MNWSLVVASNSEEVLRGTLLHSAEVKSAKDIIIQSNPQNASIAYNEGLVKATGDVIVFAHQDVYLPKGWSEQLAKSIEKLDDQDPSWAVSGAYGITEQGKSAGYVYSTGLNSFVGKPLNEPLQVSSLDEMLLIMRRDSGLRFDERLPGFHLYGTDICLEASIRAQHTYVIPCFALHNSCGITWLPLSFWRAYMYMRKKWRSRLPLVTPCTKISMGCLDIFDHVLRTAYLHVRGRKNPGRRVADPELFFKDKILPLLNVSIK